MTSSVCLLSDNVLDYPNGGGHMWVYLNWALGLRSLGVRVVWLAIPRHVASTEELREKAETLKSRLSPYHFSDSLVLCSALGKPISGVGESFDPNGQIGQRCMQQVECCAARIEQELETRY